MRAQFSAGDELVRVHPLRSAGQARSHHSSLAQLRHTSCKERSDQPLDTRRPGHLVSGPVTRKSAESYKRSRRFLRQLRITFGSARRHHRASSDDWKRYPVRLGRNGVPPTRDQPPEQTLGSVRAALFFPRRSALVLPHQAHPESGVAVMQPQLVALDLVVKHQVRVG